MIALIQADREGWDPTDEMAKLWEMQLSKYPDAALEEGTARFLANEAGRPNLAKITKHVRAAMEGVERDDERGEYTGPPAERGLGVWMHHWPDPIPEPHRARYLAAVDRCGLSEEKKAKMRSTAEGVIQAQRAMDHRVRGIQESLRRAWGAPRS